MPLVKVPRLVTVLPNFKFPVAVNCTVPPVASNAPFASKKPVLAVKVPFISEAPEIVTILEL